MLVILPSLGEQGAADAATRLRSAIEDLDLSEAAVGLRITASLGVAQRGEREGVGEWLQRADDALYLAKGDGRNRVVLAAPPDPNALRPTTTASILAASRSGD